MVPYLALSDQVGIKKSCLSFRKLIIFTCGFSNAHFHCRKPMDNQAESNTFQAKRQRNLPHYISDKGFKDTDVNLTCSMDAH